MLSVLKLNHSDHNEAGAISVEVSEWCHSGHSSSHQGKSGAWTARAFEEMSCTHFYHLWSEGTIYASNYKPGAWSPIYWSPLKGFHWCQQALDGPLELHCMLTALWLMSAGALLGEFQDWLRCPVSSPAMMGRRPACKDGAAGFYAGSKQGPMFCILCSSLGPC